MRSTLCSYSNGQPNRFNEIPIEVQCDVVVSNTYGRCFVELHKQLVQSLDQRSNGQLRRHLRVSDDIGVENRDIAMLLGIKLAFEERNKALMS